MILGFQNFCLNEELSPYAARLKAILERIPRLMISKAKDIRVTTTSGKKPELGTTNTAFRIVFDVAEDDMDDVFKIRDQVRRVFNHHFNGVNGKEDSSNGTCYSVVKLFDKEVKFFFKSPAVAKGIEYELAFLHGFEEAIKKKLDSLENQEQDVKDGDDDELQTDQRKTVETDIILDVVLTDKEGTEIKFEDVVECKSVGTQNTTGSPDKVPSRIDFKVVDSKGQETNISLKNKNYLFIDGVGGNRIEITGLERFFLDNFGSSKKIRAKDFDIEKIYAEVKGSLEKEYDGEGTHSPRNEFFGECDYVIVIDDRLHTDRTKPDNGVLKGEDRRITVYYTVEKIYTKNGKIPKLLSKIINSEKGFFGKVGFDKHIRKIFGLKQQTEKVPVRNVKGTVVREK